MTIDDGLVPRFVIRQSAIVIVQSVQSVRGRPGSACESHPPPDSSGSIGAEMSVPRRSESIRVSSASITLPGHRRSSALLAVLARDQDLGHDVDLRRLDGFGEAVHHLLRQLEARAAVGAHLLLDGHGLRDADARGPLGIGAGDRLDLLGLAFAEDADLFGLGLGERLDLRGLLLRALRTRPCPGSTAW